MVRIRHGSLALALALAFVGCKKDEKKSDPANPTAEKTEKGDVMGGGKAAMGAAAAGEDLALLPLDSELVLGINWSQVQTSALWKQFVEPKMMQGDTQKKLAEFKAKCGFDPMSSIKSVSIGLKSLGENKPNGVVVVHGLDKAKTFACLEQNKDEMTKDGTEYSKDGDVALFKNTKENQTVGLTFVNDATGVLVLGDTVNAAAVKTAAAGGSKLKDSPSFVDMYGKIRTGDSLWGLLNNSKKVFGKMSNMGINASAMYGSLNVTDGLSLDLRLRVENETAAAQLATMSKQQMGQAKQMFDQADVTTEGKDVRFTVVMSATKLNEMIKNFGGMLGGLGGM